MLQIAERQELETSYLNIQDTYLKKVYGRAHLSTKNTPEMFSFMHALIYLTNICLVSIM